MEGPRACKKEELPKVVDLINKTFRHFYGYKPTMQEEFPLLLSEDNLRCMRVISCDNKPVADVNFYETTVMIEGVPIGAASIGAVCTDEGYRGKGYSSMLLDDAEKIMREDSVDVMFVSGSRSLYTRRGCCNVGEFGEFNIEPKDNDIDFEIIDVKPGEYIEDMVNIYSKESTRYYRTMHEFKMLLKGATTNWAYLTYKVFLIKQGGKAVGYIVLEIINEENIRAEVVEFAGDREKVFKALQNIVSICKLNTMGVVYPFNDPIMSIAEKNKIQISKVNNSGTIKILDFTSLMNKLLPYFKQHVDKNIADNIQFIEEDYEGNKYIFKIENEVLCINDLEKLTKLVFGDVIGVGLELGNKPLIKEFIESVFPMPFVWAGSMNYQ